MAAWWLPDNSAWVGACALTGGLLGGCTVHAWAAWHMDRRILGARRHRT